MPPDITVDGRERFPDRPTERALYARYRGTTRGNARRLLNAGLPGVAMRMEADPVAGSATRRLIS
jgi:hypothetical protein